MKFVAKSLADPWLLEELLLLGATSCPATVINGEVIVGFDRERIERLLGIS